MRTFKLLLQYDGTDYVGWQRQAQGSSIQALLEAAVQPIEGRPVTVHGAGRTDAGVHALGQVASVCLTASIEPGTLSRALNAVLPGDVRVAQAEVAADDFHARLSATGKVYEYRIVNAPFVSPFVRRYVWHVVPRLDLAVMIRASRFLLGEHDFSAFRAAGSEAQTSIRTVRRIEWQGGGGADDPVVMLIEGDGFLRHMVRNIAGTLVQVGLGRWPVPEVEAILASRDRGRAGATAPASGLVLREVLYRHRIASDRPYVSNP